MTTASMPGCVHCGATRGQHATLHPSIHHAYEALPMSLSADHDMPVMNLTALVDNWRPGSSAEADWTWEDEARHLEEIDPDKTEWLVRDMALHGMLEPVELGHDGRVWDGHHRICAASALGMEQVPFAFMPSPEEEPPEPEVEGRPGFLHNVVGHPLLVLFPWLGERIHAATQPWVPKR